MFFKNLSKFAFGFAAICSSSYAQDSCVSSFSDLTVLQESNGNVGLVYQTASVIEIPLASGEFEINFAVDGTADVYFSLSGSNDPFAPQTITGNAGFYTEDWAIKETQNAVVEAQAAVAAAALTESGPAKVTIRFTADGFYLLRNDQQVSYALNSEYDSEQFLSNSKLYLFFGSSSANSVVKTITTSVVGDTSCVVVNPCSSAQNILNLSNTSGNRNREYNVENPIMLPCTTPGFNVALQVNADSDLYLAFSNEKGVYGADGVIEVQFGLASGRTSVSRGRYSQAKRDMLSKRYVTGLVNVEYDGSVMTIRNNGKSVMTYKVNNYKITQFYFASQTGTAVITSGTVSCNSADFCEDKQLQCTSVTTLPNNSNTSGTSKNYNVGGQYFLTCAARNFEYQAEITTTSDIYILMREPIDVSTNYIEVRAGIFSNVNSISINAFNFVPAAEIPGQTGTQTTAVIKITYVDGTMTLFVNGNQRSSQNLNTFRPNRINLASLSGTLSYKSATITCLNQIAGC
ncbi:hypothetical protein AYI70_g5659 [Smittium culicis]|uniref:Uncharacterized protein n=1 Tax=Smittium culicis TaxID=133412 RepID=A0A1R1XTH6_9FUNG|nr:hypothetical protein AYI70_g5659 [Smittium culicis]